MLGDARAVNHVREVINPETGEIERHVWRDRPGRPGAWVPEYDQDAADLERWLLHGHARRLLYQVTERDRRSRIEFSEFAWYSDVATRRVASVLVRERYTVSTDVVPAYTRLRDRAVIAAERRRAPVFRVINCCRDRVGAGVAPEVWYSDASARASFHRVAVCGSVWTCPICSRRINLGRQEHIRRAYDVFVGAKAELRPGVRDGDAMLVTFTVRHGVGDELAALFERLKRADRVQQKAYAYKRLAGYWRTRNKARVHVSSELGYVGRVSATEVTHGKNGWHPHLHQLWFFDRRLTQAEIERLRRDLFAAWRDACVAVGLPEPVAFSGKKAVGVDVRRALSAEEYLTKFGHERQWGPEREVASQHAKNGRAGRSAFQLLYDSFQGDSRASMLFKTFAEATRGRHQLQWSQGLRDRLAALGLDELLAEDQALAEARDEQARKLGELDEADWEAVIGADRHGIEAHGTLLAICKRAGFDAAVEWLRSLPSYVGGRVQRAARREQESRDHYAGDAQRARARFWQYIETLGGDVELESASEGLQYIQEPREAAQAWWELERRAQRRVRGEVEVQPEGAVSVASCLMVLGGGDDFDGGEGE